MLKTYVSALNALFIELSPVKKELMPIQEASGIFGGAVMELVNNSRISSYRIGNQGVVLRKELNQKLV